MRINGDRINFTNKIQKAKIFYNASVSNKLIKAVASEIINPKYTIGTRRNESPIRNSYSPLLDAWFDPTYSHLTYPKNSRGSLARIDSEAAGFYINTPSLYKKIIASSRNALVKKELLALRQKGLEGVRDVILEALKIVGENDYWVEWNHEFTRERYDFDLNKITNTYDEGNQRIKDLAMIKINKWLQEGAKDDFIVLDAGVGIGGTTIPILSSINDMLKSGALSTTQLSRFKFILFDIDANKILPLKNALLKNFPFSDNNLIAAPGDFYSFGENPYLAPFIDKIQCVVSNAAICHTADKSRFFKGVYKMMGNGSELIFTDPFFPLLYAPYVRIGSDNNDSLNRIVDISIPDVSRTIILNKGEKLSGDILHYQDIGANTRITTETSQDTALRYIAFASFMYPFQLGFRKELIGEENANQICKAAWDYAYNKINSRHGFSFFEYIAWLNQYSLKYFIKPEDRSKYQLIEAYEPKELYIKYCTEAGFAFISFKYLFPAKCYRDSDQQNAVSSGVGIMHFTKKKTII